MDKQKEKMLQTIKNYQGGFERLDDITMFGFKIVI